MMKKVAVLGASGHLGNNLVRRLVAMGVAVVAICPDASSATSLQGFDIETHDVDIADEKKLTELFSSCDVVFNLAAVIDVRSKIRTNLYDVNVEGSECAAKAAYVAGVKKYIHVSSVHAYTQKPLLQPIDEQRARAISEDEFPYDRSKALGELAVLKWVKRGLDASIIQPVGVIGPNDWQLKEGSAMTDALLTLFSSSIMASMVGGFNWVDVRDVTDTLLRSVDRSRAGESYLLAGEWLSNKELLTVVRDIRGNKRVPILILPLWLARCMASLNDSLSYWLNYVPSYTRHTIATLTSMRYIDDRKARGELGHRSTPIRQTLVDLQAWFVERGWIA